MEVDLTPPWERITVREAFARYAGVDLAAVMRWDALAATATAKGYPVPPGTTWDEMLGQISPTRSSRTWAWATRRSCMIIRWPGRGCPAPKPTIRAIAERFEFYIASWNWATPFPN